MGLQDTLCPQGVWGLSHPEILPHLTCEGDWAGGSGVITMTMPLGFQTCSVPGTAQCSALYVDVTTSHEGRTLSAEL